MISVDLQGRSGIVLGVANKRSLAWAIAQEMHQAGASLCFTYQNERLQAKMESLVKEMDAGPVYLSQPCPLSETVRADELRDMCVIAMADRPGADDLLPPGWRIEPFESPLIDVSSSDLRRRIAVSAPIEVLVPPRLIDYIRSHGFYSA